jgi:hypothetical protein
MQTSQLGFDNLPPSGSSSKKRKLTRDLINSTRTGQVSDVDKFNTFRSLLLQIANEVPLDSHQLVEKVIIYSLFFVRWTSRSVINATINEWKRLERNVPPIVRNIMSDYLTRRNDTSSLFLVDNTGMPINTDQISSVYYKFMRAKATFKMTIPTLKDLMKRAPPLMSGEG